MKHSVSCKYLQWHQGYDIWLTNSRGNTFSRNHTSLSPRSKAFWDFTFHDMGAHTPQVALLMLNRTFLGFVFSIFDFDRFSSLTNICVHHGKLLILGVYDVPANIDYILSLTRQAGIILQPDTVLVPFVAISTKSPTRVFRFNFCWLESGHDPSICCWQSR